MARARASLEPPPILQPVPIPETQPEPEPEPEPQPEPEAVPVPEAVPEPEPQPVAAAGTAKPRQSASRAPIAALAALAAIVGAVIGFVIAPSSHKSPPPTAALSQSTSAGPLKVSFPADWQQSGTIPSEASSLKLANAVTLAPSRTVPGAALVLGSASAVGANLLPASFVSALGTNPTGAPVTLGPHTFKRYVNLVPQNTAAALSVYALPDGHGGDRDRRLHAPVIRGGGVQRLL